MGFLDMMRVCGYCEKAVKVGLKGTCPECGQETIGFANADSKSAVLVSQWKTMSEEERNKFTERLLETVSDVSIAPVESWKYDKYITTTEKFVNAEIEEYFGVVSGTDIYTTGGVVGGGLVSQEKLFDTALLKAKKSMMAKAISMGGNAIIGVSFGIASHGGGTYTVLAITGTAVKATF